MAALGGRRRVHRQPDETGRRARQIRKLDRPAADRHRQQAGRFRICEDCGVAIRTAMRLVAYLTICLTVILANAAQADAQAPSDPQAYCVNRSADFYPYTGEPCKSGYQLGSGNCRKTDGRMVAVPREQCIAMAGTVELPFEGGIRPQAPKPMK